MLRTLFQACILDNFAEKFKLRDMEDLSFDNILSGEEVENLFADTSEVDDITRDGDPTEDKQEKDSEETEETDSTDANPFADESDEDSTEEEDKTKDEEDTNSDESTASPNFYSSIAKALTEDGVFQNLDEEALKGVKDADTFKELVSKEVNGKLNEVQRRVRDVLEWGVPPTEVQKCENTLRNLENITDFNIESSSEQADQLRKNLIYTDYMNRGFDAKRAQKEVDRSIKAGTEVEDAKEALSAIKDHYNAYYRQLQERAKAEHEAEMQATQKQYSDLKTTLLGDNNEFNDISVSKSLRRQAFDFLTKDVYTDEKTGEKLSAFQKYQDDNYAEFMKNVGICYVLTDGFKNFKNLGKPEAKKEVKSSVKELERKLSKNSSVSGGNLKFVSGVSVDDDSSFNSGSWNNYGY